MPIPILSMIVFSPLVGALMVALLPAQPLAIPRRAAFVFSIIPFVLSRLMLAAFDPAVGTLQLTETVSSTGPGGSRSSHHGHPA